jgi:hypothetical protein
VRGPELHEDFIVGFGRDEDGCRPPNDRPGAGPVAYYVDLASGIQEEPDALDLYNKCFDAPNEIETNIPRCSNSPADPELVLTRCGH